MNTFTTQRTIEPIPSLDGSNLTALQAIWSASQDHDEPAGRPVNGWWSVPAWATASRMLWVENQIVGFAAVAYTSGDTAAEARVGLLPAYRSYLHAERLIRALLSLVREAAAPQVRLYAPMTATWATVPAKAWGFRSTRTQHVMRLSVNQVLQKVRPPQGIELRLVRASEDSALLDALNRAWADTWNFRPIPAEALARDLIAYRDGMFIAVETHGEGRIVGTVHAVVDPTQHHPDGGPYAWISNLTTDPAWRGRGLGRALLATGIAHLCQRGAHSISLGVDGGAVAPMALYTSVGFQSVSTVQIWERATVSFATG